MALPSTTITSQTPMPSSHTADTPRRIAYIMSRFPKISETFILYEMIALEQRGVQIEIFPLLREHETIMHSEAASLVERAHYPRPAAVLAAQVFWLAHRPGAYLRAWWRALRGNLASPGFLLRALMIVPQAALMARRAGELGIEHVHAHYATHPALAAFVIRQLTGIPYSFTAHAHDIFVERPMLEEKIADAAFIVAISEYNRRLLCEIDANAADKIHVVHCGIDLTAFPPRDHSRRSETFTIICVASLQDYKGHPYLIDACARIRDAGVPFRCLLIGEGEDRPALEAHIARLGLGDRVLLLGRQPRQRVSELLAEADVMALPSVTTPSGKKEGIPVALMEALATGMPVVASAISGIPELVEHERTGLLTPERDSDALATALLRLCHDPDLAVRLGRAGRERVIQEFDQQQTVAQLHALFAAAKAG